MANLATTYMGLELKNPLVVGSSGLTSSLEGVVACDEAGVGAVVLKSIFEEEITAEVDGVVASGRTPYMHPEAADYVRNYGMENAVGRYISLVSEAKKAVSAPVIASIHCVSATGWLDFAKRVEAAGADALELNVFVFPSDPEHDGRANEQVYMDAVRSVKEHTSIPVAIKIGSFFSGLAHTAAGLCEAGVDAIVLFNRFLRFDFDLEKMELVRTGHLSSPDEMYPTLRWVSILAGQLECDLAATTGIHDGAAVVKQLLAGATAVQVCSAFYKHGISHAGVILGELGSWMDSHDYASVADLRGKMSQETSSNPASYERVQFMKDSVHKK
jgi:dihydroorotate dehydrogenase (fumarate)